MRLHTWSAIAGALAILLVAAGCSTKTDQQAQTQAQGEQKVEELQKQLDEAKKQLAEAGQAAAPQPQAKKTAAPAVSKQAATQPGTQAASQVEKPRDLRPAPAPPAAPTETAQRRVEEAKPVEITVPAGTIIPVRTTTMLSTKTATEGSTFAANLSENLVVNGMLIAEKGADVTGVVVSSDAGGRVKGVASLGVALRSITGVKGNQISVSTESHTAQAGKSVKKDAVRTGIATGVGAAIGAIAGGGKGAAIGAGAGAAGGVGVAMATRGEPAEIPAESQLSFKLASPVTVVLRK